MGRPKGVKNRPKTDFVQYELPKLEHVETTSMETTISSPEVEQSASVSEMLGLPTEGEKPKIITALTPAQKKRIEDEKMVKGTFVYRAKPGGRYQTWLRKYKRDPLVNKNVQGFQRIDMIDGKSYTVPQWVAEWLNGEVEGSCADWRHSAGVINLESEERAPPERVPVFRFIVQEWAA